MALCSSLLLSAGQLAPAICFGHRDNKCFPRDELRRERSDDELGSMRTAQDTPYPLGQRACALGAQRIQLATDMSNALVPAPSTSARVAEGHRNSRWGARSDGQVAARRRSPWRWPIPSIAALALPVAREVSKVLRLYRRMRSA